MARCLEIMRDPTLENAVSAARQLQQLAGTQQGEAKAATDKLALRRLKQRLRDVPR
jgi:pantoate kinase